MEQSNNLLLLQADLNDTLGLSGQLTDSKLKLREVEWVRDSVYADIKHLLEQMNVHIDEARFPQVVIANTQTAFYGKGIIYLSNMDIDTDTSSVDSLSSGEEGMHWVHDEVNNNGEGWPKGKYENFPEAPNETQWREFIGALGPIILYDAFSEEECNKRFPKGLSAPPSLQEVTKTINDLRSKYERFERKSPACYEAFMCAMKLQEFASHYPANNHAYLLDRSAIKDWDAVLRMSSDDGIKRFFCNALDFEEK